MLEPNIEDPLTQRFRKKREILEETSLNIKVIKKISEYEYKRPDNSITFGCCYLAVSDSDSITLNNELDDFKWITFQEFKDYPHIKELDEEVEKAFS